MALKMSAMHSFEQFEASFYRIAWNWSAHSTSRVCCSD